MGLHNIRCAAVIGAAVQYVSDRGFFSVCVRVCHCNNIGSFDAALIIICIIVFCFYDDPCASRLEGSDNSVTVDCRYTAVFRAEGYLVRRWISGKYAVINMPVFAEFKYDLIRIGFQAFRFRLRFIKNCKLIRTGCS